jgi:ureidoglycolate hydrolase
MTGATSSIERTSILAPSNLMPMSPPRTIVLVAEPLTHEAFAPFGALPADEGTLHDRAEAEFLLADGAVNYISHARDEVPTGDIGLRCELLNRHDTHTQTLMPVDADSIIVVAPADVAFDEDGQLDTVRAFRVNRYECIHLWRGTWHWGPFPLGAASVRLLNVQGRGYPRDNGVAELDLQLGAVFEIDTGD